MKKSDIIIAGIAGTTAFTLFSYLLANTFKKDYEEPELLGKMADSLVPGMNEKQAQFTGWLMHYLVGHALATSYSMLINKTSLKSTIKNGIITGTLTGLPAALTWDTALKMHPAPPRKRSLHYYIQLAAGHAIFGATTFFVLGLFSKRNNAQKQV